MRCLGSFGLITHRISVASIHRARNPRGLVVVVVALPVGANRSFQLGNRDVPVFVLPLLYVGVANGVSPSDFRIFSRRPLPLPDVGDEAVFVQVWYDV